MERPISTSKHHPYIAWRNYVWTGRYPKQHDLDFEAMEVNDYDTLLLERDLYENGF